MSDVSFKEVALGSYTVSLANIARIYDALAGVVAEQADIDLARWTKLPEQSEEDFQNAKANARQDAYKVTATVRFGDGTMINGSSPDLFKKDPQGANIALVYMTNASAFRAAANLDPRNRFDLWLDFAQPPLLDANTFISAPTSNSTNLKIEGDRAGWIAGIEKAVLERIDQRHNLRRFLHGHFVYDYGLLLVGAPFSLYLCWLVAPYVTARTASTPILEAAVFVYVFFAGVWAYRTLFSYLRWAYPIAELSDQGSKPKKHRLFWWGIVLTISGKVFWDLVDPVLSLRGLLSN